MAVYFIKKPPIIIRETGLNAHLAVCQADASKQTPVIKARQAGYGAGEYPL
jgi:hypothetical protein